ncbi:MAG: FAD-dependent oxidoreductase, partial [Verrucomicrobiota bacterium]
MRVSEIHNDFDVVILGGGFAGVYCGKAIQQALGRRPGLKLAFLSEQNYMVFQPMLPEVAGGSLLPTHVVNPIRKLCPMFHVMKARVDSIDLQRRVVEIQAGHGSKRLAVRF